MVKLKNKSLFLLIKTSSTQLICYKGVEMMIVKNTHVIKYSHMMPKSKPILMMSKSIQTQFITLTIEP